MRAFIALPLSREERSAIQRIQNGLQAFPPFACFRWLPPSNIHMTLQFLGEISEEAAETAAAVLRGVCASRGVILFSLERLGVFPNARNPRVLWIGPSHPTEELMNLGEALAEGLKTAGYSREKGFFRPHLTLARRRQKPPSSKKMREALREAEIRWLTTPVLVQSVEAVLFRSELRPEGAVYQPLCSVSLHSQR